MAVTSRQLAAYVYKEENICRIKRDLELYNIYNGKVRDTVKQAIVREFKKPESIQELLKRVIPINIIQKVVNKLGAVYKVPPTRKAQDESENDQDSIDLFVEASDFNSQMKNFNRYIKLTKSACLEPYVSDEGVPSVRILPSHTFTQYSDSATEPNKPTHTIKHLVMQGERKDHVHVVWSKDRHYVMNGYGVILEDIGNPYEINPIVYTKEGIELIPIEDDDLYFLQIAICLLLTDLSFGAKYQSWSIIAVIGAEGTQNLTFNPNSVVTIPKSKDGTQGDMKTIQPQVSTEAVLRLVEALVGLLLTTKNLSVGNVSLKLEGGGDTASGVAKILDATESTEDKQDQRAMLLSAEKQLFKNLKVMVPIWKESGALDAAYADLNFSEEFVASIQFSDPKPQISEKEIVETEKLKMDNKFSTLELSLSKIYPEKNQQEIADLRDQILEEQREINSNTPQDEETQGDEVKSNGVVSEGSNQGEPAKTPQDSV